jgi:hypothetical protein
VLRNDLVSPADFNLLDEKWVFFGKKIEGVNQNGGFYHDHLDSKRQVLFKQDLNPAKDITEKTVSDLMRAFFGALSEDPESIARIELAWDAKSKHQSDETGKNVYVASVLFKEYVNVYEDAPKAFNNLPRYESLLNELGKATLPDSRPKFIEPLTPQVKNVIQSGRYTNLAKLMALNVIFDNADVHLANIGAVPLNERATKNADVYDNVKAVILDFGSALGSRRLFGLVPIKFDDKLHHNSFFRYILPGGPPNYHLKLPIEITHSQEFIFELQLLSKLAEYPVFLESSIDSVIDEIAKYYGYMPLKNFAEKIGVTTLYRIPENKEQLKIVIKLFLFSNLTKRLKEAGKIADDLLAEEIKLNKNMQAYLTPLNRERERINRLSIHERSRSSNINFRLQRITFCIAQLLNINTNVDVLDLKDILNQATNSIVPQNKLQCELIAIGRQFVEDRIDETEFNLKLYNYYRQQYQGSNWIQRLLRWFQRYIGTKWSQNLKELGTVLMYSPFRSDGKELNHKMFAKMTVSNIREKLRRVYMVIKEKEVNDDIDDRHSFIQLRERYKKATGLPSTTGIFTTKGHVKSVKANKINPVTLKQLESDVTKFVNNFEKKHSLLH